jgi:hypothetical protein
VKEFNEFQTNILTCERTIIPRRSFIIGLKFSPISSGRMLRSAASKPLTRGRRSWRAAGLNSLWNI